MIGSGAISDIYLTNMIHRFDNLEVLAVASRTPENARKKAELYGTASCTVEELLKNPEIEMIVNLTPANMHYDLIKRSLLAGKHVYTEKTMTDDLEKSRELLELAERQGLYLGSAPDTFLGSALQTARAAIDDGMLGDIHSFAISANRCNDVLLSIAAFLRAPGGGILYDYAVYYLTALVAVLGPVERVGGVKKAPYPIHVGTVPGSRDYGKVFDSPNESEAAAVLLLENGIMGTFHVNADSVMEDQAYFAIYGTKGILYLTDPNQFGGKVKFLPNPLDPFKSEPAVELWNFTPYQENSRGIGPSDMASAIEKGTLNRASKELAFHVQEILTAVLNSDEKGNFTDILSRVDRPAPLPVHNCGITGLAHLSLQMKNTEKMLHFYRDILGMQELFTLTSHDFAAMSSEAASLREKPEIPWITYMKLADRRYIELFYDMGTGYRTIADRKENYGFMKYNLEVSSIQEIHDRLTGAGVEIREGIHPTLDGALEIVVLDPDGNEVQFTEYTDQARLPLTDNPFAGCSHVLSVTQAAFQVQDAYNMCSFYTRGLGLKKVMTLTFKELGEALGDDSLRQLGDRPWIDYIEAAPHQYIELFYEPGTEKGVERDLSDTIGYQHLCLEVGDIHAAWDACRANGLVPDTDISLGSDGAWQFWLTDPDGNRLELMQYTETAKQLR